MFPTLKETEKEAAVLTRSGASGGLFNGMGSIISRCPQYRSSFAPTAATQRYHRTRARSTSGPSSRDRDAGFPLRSRPPEEAQTSPASHRQGPVAKHPFEPADATESAHPACAP